MQEGSSALGGEAVEKGFVQVGPLSMYYEACGRGDRPLVLIHGGGSTLSTSFEAVIPLFARTRRVIAVELQGHGHTAELERPYTFTGDADDVAGLLQALGVSRADFLGFSNGGNTALQLGMRHPLLVNRLVVASSFYRRDAFVPGFFEGMEASGMEAMPDALKVAYLEINHDPQGLETMHRKDKERMVGFTDWDDGMLASVKAPVLVLGGDRDVMSPEHLVRMSRLLPAGRLMILPGNHGSYIGERTACRQGDPVVPLVVRIIESFLDADT